MLSRIIISALLLAPTPALLLPVAAGCGRADPLAPQFAVSPSAAVAELPRPGADGRWLATSLEPFDAPRVLASRGDRVVVTALWATWCEPCIAEMPELDAFHKAHPEVVVLGLATDPASSAAAIQKVLDRVRPTYAQALLADGEGPFLSHLGLEWDGILPKTVMIAGEHHQLLTSPVTRATLEAALAPYLAR